ncbi:hypothetical protein PITCH_A230175 [uncultured Desulfobacterium sp.]|uniref:Uncharacterized protein n=1 Tax=uncultured Desulfobacterium sp. TaxID=201089 RepID=A0A445MYJ3_9BACT|nr:hypothetical protein PITCH_A230175 [uncultured Desulfobacterium sp.]
MAYEFSFLASMAVSMCEKKRIKL